MSPGRPIRTSTSEIYGRRVPRWVAVVISAAAMLSAFMAAPTTHPRVDVTIDYARGIAIPIIQDLEPGVDVPLSGDILEEWARHNVRGVRVVDLTGLDPVTARELVSVAAGLSQALELDVEVLAPTARWNEVTGQPSAESPMFANRFGVGFNPSWWSAYRARTIHTSEAVAGADTDPHAREYAAHEIAHVWEDAVSTLAPPETAEALRALVEAYRSTRGREAVVSELGSYAWSGGGDYTRHTWRETWAEAFAHYATDRAHTSRATRSLVERALLLNATLRSQR
ncbi:MAG: hypothetical protein ACYC5Q_09885 [Thermoleophilia bacterium]